MSDSTKRDIRIAIVIIMAVVLLITIGWIWGTRTGANVACRNLGYEKGYLTNLYFDAAIVCESTHEMPLPDMQVYW